MIKIRRIGAPNAMVPQRQNRITGLHKGTNNILYIMPLQVVEKEIFRFPTRKRFEAMDFAG
jgi:hypothetical protein